ncbi:MAG TPA: glutamate racemase, partial [Candidatus Omnitrophica bacterium]|nr:glutamate racemase [Candidatus Omnitrophota bacterium]
MNGAVCRLVTEQYLEPLKQQGIDTLIMGCTHYPLLAPTVGQVMGEGVTLIDSAKETVAEVRG